MDRNFSDSFTFLPQGGIIQEFKVADRNIVLGFPSAVSYQSEHHSYFGQTIGRVANRISGAHIKDLNGKSHNLAANNGPNTLHGGVEGWGRRDFEGPTPILRKGRDAVLFKYVSEDSEEAFAGTVELRVWYYPGLEVHDGIEKTSLEIEYEAELVGDGVDETVVSVTNHSYFNIGDAPTIEGTRATLYTNLHQPTDDTDIPTGEISAYPGITASKEFTLGSTEPSVDHCFIMDTDASNIPLDTRERPMKMLCSFYHPSTGIQLEALSTEPAFQFYTGEFLDVPAMDGMPARGPRSGMCIEASRYVNAVNDERWRQMVVLKKGQIWLLRHILTLVSLGKGSRTVYRAWSA